jgi:hypothetical protein
MLLAAAGVTPGRPLSARRQAAACVAAAGAAPISRQQRWLSPAMMASARKAADPMMAGRLAWRSCPAAIVPRSAPLRYPPGRLRPPRQGSAALPCGCRAG